MVEHYAATILKKMLTNDDPGYVDLTSPAGIGIGALVYNYDGDVYASDEGRMLAEMGDKTFRLGNLHQDSYEEIMLSEALLAPLDESFTGSVPMCQDCAFEPYCGADPTYHHATEGDYVGRKPTSAFHRRNMRDLQAAARPLRGRPGRPRALPRPGPAIDRAARQVRPQCGTLASRSRAVWQARRLRTAHRRSAATAPTSSRPVTPAPGGFDLYLTRTGRGTRGSQEPGRAADRSSTTSRGGDVVALEHDGAADPRALATPEPSEQHPADRALQPLLPDVLAAAEDARSTTTSSHEAFELIRLLPRETGEIGFTGGEPTLYGED